ncbi:uncharacterized protein LOC115262604 [Aedes albopictus]|uniref:Uncharacterized protein n=1 Tax=Aedes albopictus TaxID=7160 RepID=A0ABM1ZEV6_AEDAL
MALNLYDYRADELDEDEVNYELQIRGYPYDNAFDRKRRDLRTLLNEDRKNPRLYTVTIPLEQDLLLFTSKITNIHQELQQRVTSRSRSRLISLRNRILRAPSANANLKQKLITDIDSLLNNYFDMENNQATMPSHQRLAQNTSVERETAQRELNPQATSYFPPTSVTASIQRTSLTPNASFSVPIVTSSPSFQGLRPLGDINLQDQAAALPNPTNATPQNSLPTNAPPPQRQGQSVNPFTEELKQFIKDSIKEAVRVYVDEWAQFSTPLGHNNVDNPATHSIGINTSRQNTATPLQDNQPDFANLNNSQNQSACPNPNPGYYNHLRTKIEKWQIYFSGEPGPKSLSVSEFIRQVTILVNDE